MNALEREKSDPTATCIETHGAWIVLHGAFAYKIKKPVNLGFLDFSTLEKRAFFCEEEVRLNRRLTDIYLGVIALYRERDHWFQGPVANFPDKVPTEFVVLMHRIDPQLQMDVLLEAGKVENRHILSIAQQLSAFHQSAAIAAQKPLARDLKKDFDDISTVVPMVRKLAGDVFAEGIQEMVGVAGQLLTRLEKRIEERNALGWVRDVHGDVHSGNIFLTEVPIIFDCIEFNRHFREVDVLSEIAFLCMDLERLGRKDLSDLLLQAYLDDIEAISEPLDRDLLLYYKLYRLNVRIKVKSIQAAQHASDTEKVSAYQKEMQEYFGLLSEYLIEGEERLGDQ